MTVQCPRCGTQYRVPDARLSEARPVFKCTRCSHVFSRAERATSRAGGRGREPDRNLSFTFDRPTGGTGAGERASPGGAREEEAELELDDESIDDEVESSEDLDLGIPDDVPAHRTARSAPSPSHHKTEARGSVEPAFVSDLGREARTASRGEAMSRRTAPRAARRDEEDDVRDSIGPDEDEDGPLLISEPDHRRRAPIQPRRGPAAAPRRSPLRPIAIGVGTVVLAFLVIAAIFARRPDLAFEELGDVPLLGRLLGDDHLLVWRLQISGVETGIDHIKDASRPGSKLPVLVVTGQVLNTTNQKLNLIEVEGRLLADGVERRRQKVPATNQDRKIIGELSSSEVEMMLKLQPRRAFVVHPGESASFLLVFPDPPANATEVTCQVVDARPT